MEENSFDEMAPPSAATSGKSSSSEEYHVFINHRGPDVKKSVASVLYHFLQTLGLRVFLDSQELEVGGFLSTNIENAIRTCPIDVAIFSQNYASSPWCLAELSQMLEVKAKIVPVFYNVRLSDLRYINKGAYANAFSYYEEKGRYLDKLQEWKEALHKASFISGIEFRDDNNDDLGILCKNVVDTVLNEMKNFKNNFKLEVAEYPVGLDKVTEEIETMIRAPSYGIDRRIFGIVGAEGVGKTTVAKEFYNRHHSEFYRSCFLFNVREAYENNNIVKLQKKMLSDLKMPVRSSTSAFGGGKSNEISAVNMLKTEVQSWYLEPLIILDDVDDVEQMEALAVNEFLKYKALVIVTSRHANILQGMGIYRNICQLEELDINEGRELFCSHVFGQKYPLRGSEKIVEDFVKASGGLPSNIIMLGQHFRSLNAGRKS